MNEEIKNKLRSLPAVDKLLTNEQIQKLTEKYGVSLVTFSIRETLEDARKKILSGKKSKTMIQIVNEIEEKIKDIREPSLKPVINATGIVLHTNLSRAPLGLSIFRSMKAIIQGYSNLEFDLKTGKRGQRNDHIKNLLRYITSAEDAVVVNNNAAAVLLCLITFAKGKEVIISRGELIEIGGSFRIPDIMKSSGAKMVEVGTTNRTRLSDYENAITPKTRIIFKAHKSNYEIKGFSEEVEIRELVDLAHKNNLLMIYDIGSGLLKKPEGLKLENEPDVRNSISDGADIVSFSGDKLLGGPQAGIIVGKKALIGKLRKSPLMRVLRVGKLTMSGLINVVSAYLEDSSLVNDIPIFEMLNRSQTELRSMAEELQEKFSNKNIVVEIIPSKARVGGGTLPGLEIDSFAVKLVASGKERNFAEKIFRKLLNNDKAVLGILREGNLLFDVQSLFKEDLTQLVEIVSIVLKNDSAS
jgi:L-seryl-tRNA(Ser) seleniumtransferase